MTAPTNRCLTERSHWDDAWNHTVRMRLPSRLLVGTLNMIRLLSRHVQPGMRVLEIGCAPGKLLAWVAACRKAQCAGMDYSEVGIDVCKRLFSVLGLRG